mmetsp:Transcript_48064/g.57959  ORF Transcript_48064/g.57959 Transcript_48064/m.57959 type:complete len:190 (-) Transcript_48064:8-577(-)
MYGIQQIRLNYFAGWKYINKIEDGNQNAAVIWSDDVCSSNKPQLAFQIGLIEGLSARIKKFKRSQDTRRRNTFKVISPTQEDHTIIDRGNKYQHVRCAVCMHLKKTIPSTRTGMKTRQSKHWCPHQNCRYHVCSDHRGEVHGYYDDVVILSTYHKLKRVKYTQEHPGEKKKPDTSRRKYNRKQLQHGTK